MAAYRPVPKPRSLNSLPPEALARVFKALQPQVPVAELLTLAQVCRLWADILQGPSELWESLSVQTNFVFQAVQGRQRLASFLSWARQRMRSVTRLQLELWSTSSGFAVLGVFCHLQRLDLNYTFRPAVYQMSHMIEFLPVYTPQLERLTIDHTGDDDSITHVINCAPLRPLALTHLSLDAIVLVAQGGRGLAHAAQGLVSLCMDISNWRNVVSLSTLQHLEHLNLWTTSAVEEHNGTLEARHAAELPVAVQSLGQLTALALGSLEAVDELLLSAANHPVLEELTLDNLPRLDALPSAMWRMTSLRALTLTDVGLLHGLDYFLAPLCNPATLAGLGSLQALELHDMQLARLPSVVCALAGLTRLALAHNGLDELPGTISQLACLRELSLSGQSNMRLSFSALMALSQLSTLEVCHCGHVQFLPSSRPALSLLLRRHPALVDLHLHGSTIA